MMRPMKLAGSELMFGQGCLEYIKSVPCKRAMIVIGGSSVEKNGTLAKVEEYFHEAGAETTVFRGVEPDPHFASVRKGAIFVSLSLRLWRKGQRCRPAPR